MSTRDAARPSSLEEAIASAQLAFEDGRLDEAITRLKAVLRGPTTAEAEVRTRCLLSETYEKLGLNHEQLETLKKYDTLAGFERLPEPIQTQLLVRLAWAHSYNNDIPRAIALFNQAMRLARAREDQAGIGASYFGLGRAYRFVAEIRIARDHYRAALDYFRRVGSWREIAECYFNIGNIMMREGDYRSALYSINQAIAIIGDRNEHELLGRAYGDLALLYENLDISSDRAIALWEKCIESFEQTGNPWALGVNYNNLACQLIVTGEWTRAEEMVGKAIEMLRGTPRLSQLGGALDTLAQIHILKGDLDEAEALLQESLDAFEIIKKKQPINREFILEPSTWVSFGRCEAARGRPDQAREHFQRAVDIAVRLGDRQFLTDARLRLVDALLQLGELGEAGIVLDKVQRSMRRLPEMVCWGLMMRMAAKVSAASGHVAAALQSLSQSTSMYEMKGNRYELAVNRVVLAGLLEQQGRPADALREVEAALEVYRLLGAKIEVSRAETRVSELASNVATSAGDARRSTPVTGTDLASAMDGFLAQRLLRASVTKELLLYELTAIARSIAAASGAIVAEIAETDEMHHRKSFKRDSVLWSGPSRGELQSRLDELASIPEKEYERRFVYRLSDNQQSDYLLYVIGPRSERFVSGTINLEPLLALASQGLENELLRSKTRRAGVFNPAKLLAEVEIPGFVCASRAMSRVLEQIHKIRSSDVTVLITGESGTGKELVARAVHAGSSRRISVFLPFNCSASPHDMVESQLFGYRKGAFTGAVASNPGIIRAAEHGTLLLDEIGDLPLDLQPKLLRFLQEGEIHPIGENQPITVDVRVLAATNSDLEKAVAEGRFREDLFHRLNVIRIQVPPLRERREEIPALVNHYVKLYREESAKADIDFSEEALDLMVVYDWPGNVRQLCNEIRRVVTYAESGTVVTPDMLSPQIAAAMKELPGRSVHSNREIGPGAPTPRTISEAVEELERQMIKEALHRSSGNIARAAKDLGLSRKGLYLKMDRLNFRY